MDEAICPSRVEPTFDREGSQHEWPAPPVATVDFSPAELVKHVLGRWRGLHAETIQVVSHAPFEYSFKHTHHLLVAIEQGSRYDGELLVEGLPTSKQRGCSHKLILVPAGRRFFGWQRPRALTRSVCLYIDPTTVAVDPDCRFNETELEGRMLFDNSAVWQTVEKLKVLIGSGDPASDLYAEALGGVLAHELLRLHGGSAGPSARIQGGLAGWQQKRVTEFIEGHLTDGISLAALADQVQLSRFHFARAFKESFGEPPYRYLVARRIDRAKALLARPHLSVTTIALDLGFGSSSAFTVAFRRIVGRTPSAYRRMLV